MGRYLHLYRVITKTFGLWLRPLGAFMLLQVRQVISAATLGLDHLFYPRHRKQPIDRPIFIIGNPRSGTTFLHRLLLGAGDMAAFEQFACNAESRVDVERCHDKRRSTGRRSLGIHSSIAPSAICSRRGSRQRLDGLAGQGKSSMNCAAPHPRHALASIAGSLAFCRCAGRPVNQRSPP